MTLVPEMSPCFLFPITQPLVLPKPEPETFPYQILNCLALADICHPLLTELSVFGSECKVGSWDTKMDLASSVLKEQAQLQEVSPV